MFSCRVCGHRSVQGAATSSTCSYVSVHLVNQSNYNSIHGYIIILNVSLITDQHLLLETTSLMKNL